VARRVQIQQSPYYGQPDFAALDAASGPSQIDPVSVADLLRNAFVYPPHSIYQNVKLVSLGFESSEDMCADPEFLYPFRETDQGGAASQTSIEALLETYHRLLCEAVDRAATNMVAPWMLQSGGKDSTSLAIAMSEVRPDATCLTYLGGSEENEVASARLVAKKLGLRHEYLVCNPGRAYDRYLAAKDRMPLLTADFALLSYLDLATVVSVNGGDGIVDGLGSDCYFGTPASSSKRLLAWLAKRSRWPRQWVELPLIENSFELCFLLGTLQMHGPERHFPGSRFSDEEVDTLMGRKVAAASRRRLAPFEKELASATSEDELRAMLMCIAEGAAAFAKGLYSGSALSMPIAYPYCDRRLREWVFREVPRDKQIDLAAGTNKILVREHIARRFGDLPYVGGKKGSFRFDLVGLARDRFDQVRSFADDARHVLPGAVQWLDRNRRRMHNKFHASRFYLLAVILPWLGHPEEAWKKDDWWQFTAQAGPIDSRLAQRKWVRVPSGEI
jgi:hypothetical protein